MLLFLSNSVLLNDHFYFLNIFTFTLLPHYFCIGLLLVAISSTHLHVDFPKFVLFLQIGFSKPDTPSVAYITKIRIKNKVLFHRYILRDCHQFLFLISSEFKWINWLVFLLKSEKKCGICDFKYVSFTSF